MKKGLLLCSFLIVSLTMLAQIPMTSEFKDVPSDVLSNIDKMGMDECLLLTELEGKFFNALYHEEKQEFDMCGKKVAFLTGESGTKIGSKKWYFAAERSCLKLNYSPIFSFLYIFNTTQKEESGGYDAAIVYACKMSLSNKKVVRRLKKHL